MRLKLTLSFVTVLLLAACVMPGKGNSSPVASETLPPTPGPSPTYTPTPIIPLTVLVIPADTPPKQAEQYQTTFYELAQQAGMHFQVLNSLTLTDIQLFGAALKVAIVFPPDPGLTQLAAAAPGAQFLAVGIPGLAASGNLSIIGVDRSTDKQAFLAGYIAAMLALDYRVGIITSEDAEGQAAQTAFTNGMHYFCGLCQPAFPPWYEYPVHPIIPTSELESQYPGYVIPLKNYDVAVAYVYPGVATFDLLDAMAQYGLWIIGESMPSDDVRPNWVVSIQPDLMSGVLAIYPELVAGNGGQSYATPLILADVHTGMLTEGKLRLVNEVLTDLQAGLIDTGVQP